ILSAEPVDDVTGRAAAKRAVAVGALVELRQRRFDEAGGHADQRDGPHPEHGSGTAEGDRNRDARDIAAADTTPDGNEKRLARADCVGITALVLRRQDTEHPAEVFELHEAAHDGDEYAEDHEDRYE